MNHSSVMQLPECYRILNVPPGVKWGEVKKSYRTLAFKSHPDRHPDDAGCENQFKEISRAFKTLESYYQTSGITSYEYRTDAGEEEVCVAEPVTEQGRNFFKSILQQQVDRKLVADVAERMQEVLCEWEKKVFMLDVEREISIDPVIAEKGGVVKIRQGRESFEVPIPPGAWNRMSLKIAGKGEASWFRRRRGDLLLNIRVISSDSRVGAGDRDLYYDFPVSREKIENRNMLTLNTVQGAIKFTLPRNTIDGQSFVLKARPVTQEVLRTSHIVKVRLV